MPAAYFQSKLQPTDPPSQELGANYQQHLSIDTRPVQPQTIPERWFDIGGQSINVKIWKGRLYVGLRQFVYESGQWKPTRNGINLTQGEWVGLYNHMEEINKAVAEIAPYAIYWP